MDQKSCISRNYKCPYCNAIHEIMLQKSIIKNQSEFPFPYVYLHGELKDILTTLYLDKNLEIRGVETKKLADDDIFSKEQVLLITNTLMLEIERLRDENILLQEKINKLVKK